MADSKESNREEFRQCLRQIDKLLIEGDFDEAKKELARAKKLDPRNPFIVAFQERITHFEGKGDGDRPEGDRVDAAVGPEDTAAASPGDATAPDDREDQALRNEVEEEYRAKFTEELRKAEEQTKNLLAEEKENLERNLLKQRVENEREYARIKQEYEKEYQNRLAEEIKKTEQRLEGEYESEIARMQGDLMTKMHQQYQAQLIEEKERLKNEIRGITEKERQSLAETEQLLREEFEKKLTEETEKAGAELRAQLGEKHRQEEEKLKIQLTAEFEERMAYEQRKIGEESEKLRKKGEDTYRLEIAKLRQSQSELEKKLKEEYNKKLLESVRKAEQAYEEQAKLRSREEQEKLRSQLSGEFEAALAREQKSLKKEYEGLNASLEKSSQEEIARIKAQGETRIAEQTAAAKKQFETEFERRSAALRNELESKYQVEYEAKLHEEREKIRQESERKITSERERMEKEYQEKLQAQNEKLKNVRKELRAEMDANFLKRMETISREFDAKLDLLGVRLPETKAEQVNYYREAMLNRYSKGDLNVEDAKKLLQLKELLALTFDEHLTIETEVRLKVFSERVRKGILSGAIDPGRAGALDRLKDQYGITDDEAKDMQHHLLASFGKLKMKGRVLVVDDDTLLLRTIEDYLTDGGYNVVTAEDVDTALEKLQSMPFDLILSDIKFSDNDFDGFRFFKSVQALPHYAGLPFIFMSALQDGVIVRSGVQLGVDDYLTKPIDPELLTAVIEGKLKRFRALKFQ